MTIGLYLFFSSLVSNPVDPVRRGLSLSRVSVRLLLDSVPQIPDDAMSSGPKECESRSLLVLRALLFPLPLFFSPFLPLSIPAN
jgi:hypothetical protein